MSTPPAAPGPGPGEAIGPSEAAGSGEPTGPDPETPLFASPGRAVPGYVPPRGPAVGDPAPGIPMPPAQGNSGSWPPPGNPAFGPYGSAPGPYGAGPGAPSTPVGYDGQTYYAPGWQPPRPPLEPLAVASVPAGLLLGPVGIGLGAAALSRIRRTGSRGRGLALIGLWLGVAVTIGWIAVVVITLLAAQARAPLPTDVSAPQSASSRQLVLGNCLAELPDDGEIGTVRVVPCADEHHAQVVARTDMAQEATWPGQDVANQRVSRVCTVEALGSDVDPESVELVVWTPSEASWADGDRTGLCVASSETPLTGSLID